MPILYCQKENMWPRPITYPHRTTEVGAQLEPYSCTSQAVGQMLYWLGLLKYGQTLNISRICTPPYKSKKWGIGFEEITEKLKFIVPLSLVPQLPRQSFVFGIERVPTSLLSNLYTDDHLGPMMPQAIRKAIQLGWIKEEKGSIFFKGGHALTASPYYNNHDKLIAVDLFDPYSGKISIKPPSQVCELLKPPFLTVDFNRLDQQFGSIDYFKIHLANKLETSNYQPSFFPS